MKRILGIFFFLSLFSNLSSAGILIEPYLGYETGSSSATTTELLGGPDKIDSKETGTAYGLRLGYRLPMLVWFALDASMGTGKTKADGSSTDSDISKSSVGLDVGINFPILVRAWLGYNFSQSLTAKGTDGAGDTTYKGTATKLGVSFTGLPIVCLNLEYTIYNYTTADVPGLGSGKSVSDFYSKFDSNAILFSISAPFNL